MIEATLLRIGTMHLQVNSKICVGCCRTTQQMHEKTKAKHEFQSGCCRKKTWRHSGAKKKGHVALAIIYRTHYRVGAAKLSRRRSNTKNTTTQPFQRAAPPLTCVAGAGGGAIADADAPLADDSMGCERIMKTGWLTGEERPSEIRKPSKDI